MIQTLISTKRMFLLGTLFIGISLNLRAESPTITTNNFSTEQQSSMLKGFVIDAVTGEPIIGATVYVKALGVGAVTGINGEYELNAPIGSIIQISYVGYNSVEVKSIESEQTIKLKENSEILEEVVVVGYGIQKKANLTGSVATVDSKMIEIDLFRMCLADCKD